MKVGERRLLPPMSIRQMDRKPRLGLGDMMVVLVEMGEAVRCALAMSRGITLMWGWMNQVCGGLNQWLEETW